MSSAIIRTTALLAVASQVSGRECNEFWKVMGTCVEGTGMISCSDDCKARAIEARSNREMGVDCENLPLCGYQTGLLQSCNVGVNGCAPKNDRFPWHRPSAALSVQTTLKCPDGGGSTEINLPCLGADQPIIYFSVDIHDTSGYEYEVYSTDGSPTGLMEVFNINDVQNDEIMDCFASDTIDTATCQNAKISRGYQLPKSVTFDPKITIRFGFKACSAPEPAASCRNVLVFRTAPKKTVTKGDPPKHGCISAVVQVPQPSLSPICIDSAAAGVALSLSSMLFFIILSML